MAVSNLFIMPGLHVPDANFNWPIGSDADCGWSATNIAAGEYYYVGPRPQGNYDCASSDGTGRSLSMDLSSMPASGTYTDYIESDYTPYEVAAGPASYLRLRLWVGVIAATADMSSETSSNGVLKVSIIGYDADGTQRETMSKELMTTRSESVFKLYQGVIEETEFTTSVRWYKVRIAICKHSASSAGQVVLDWVGVGLSHHATDTGPDLTSWYGAQGSHSAQTDRRWISGQYNDRPYVMVNGRAAHLSTMSLQFPYIQTADKRLINTAWMWNAGTPSDDFSGSIDYTHAAVNRGTSQPVIVVPDRANMKRAMYADFAGAPNWNQATQGWWPESSEIWATDLTFRERF